MGVRNVRLGDATMRDFIQALCGGYKAQPPMPGASTKSRRCDLFQRQVEKKRRRCLSLRLHFLKSRSPTFVGKFRPRRVCESVSVGECDRRRTVVSSTTQRHNMKSVDLLLFHALGSTRKPPSNVHGYVSVIALCSNMNFFFRCSLSLNERVGDVVEIDSAIALNGWKAIWFTKTVD